MTNTNTKSFILEALILGKWVVVSRGWSAVERDSHLRRCANDPTLRFKAA
jgi:hypothetical protein